MERFDATLEEGGRGGALVVVPAEVVAALGGGGRIPVRVTFDGLPYQGSMVSMGGRMVVGVLKAIRGELGKGPGDVIAVTLERDDAERVVAVPEDVQRALSGAGLAERFAALSFTHQREYVGWVEEAKKPQTRARRVAQMVERLTPPG